MPGEAAPPSTESKAVAAARAFPKADFLADVVLEVLVDQAEKKTPFPNPAVLTTRVQEAGLEKVDGETPYGNVLLALERGAHGAAETEIVAAFFGVGLGRRLEGIPADERGSEIRRLLPVLDWLHAWCGLDTFAAADDALAPEIARTFWDECVAELASGMAPSRAALARRVLRVEALRASGLPERETLLGRVAQGASDPAVCAVAGGEAATGTGAPRLTGRYGGRPPTPLRRLVALGTGWAALTGLLSSLGRLLLGFRRTATVSLVHRGIRVERRIDLLGRTIRKSEEVVPFASLALVARETRFPYLYLLVGVAGMALGAMWGVFRVVDSIRGAYLPLALIGLAAIFLGVVFDLALFSFWPWRRGRTQVHLLRRPKKWLRILDVSESDAHRLLAAVTERLRAQ